MSEVDDIYGEVASAARPPTHDVTRDYTAQPKSRTNDIQSDLNPLKRDLAVLHKKHNLPVSSGECQSTLSPSIGEADEPMAIQGKLPACEGITPTKVSCIGSVQQESAAESPTTITNQVVTGASSDSSSSGVTTRAPAPVVTDISRVHHVMTILGRLPKKANAPIEDTVLGAIPNALHETAFCKLAIRAWERAGQGSIVEYMRFVVQFVDLSGRLGKHSTEVLADRIADEMNRQLIGAFAELDSIDSSAEDGGTVISLGADDTIDSSSKDSFVDGSSLASDDSEDWMAGSESSSESIEDRKERERERKRHHKKDKHKKDKHKKRHKKHKKEKKHTI